MYWILKNWKIYTQVVTPSLNFQHFPLCPPRKMIRWIIFLGCHSQCPMNLASHRCHWPLFVLHPPPHTTLRHVPRLGCVWLRIPRSRTTEHAPLLHDPCTYGLHRARTIVSDDTMFLWISNLRCNQIPVSSTASLHRGYRSTLSLHPTIIQPLNRNPVRVYHVTPLFNRRSVSHSPFVR